MFILTQVKSKRLPPIDACQKNIFQELRNREEKICRRLLVEKARQDGRDFFKIFSAGRDITSYAVA